MTPADQQIRATQNEIEVDAEAVKTEKADRHEQQGLEAIFGSEIRTQSPHSGERRHASLKHAGMVRVIQKSLSP